MRLPGTQLEQLCASGRREVLLVAPFIKVGALMRLLAQVREHISLRCVTRWRPEEIVTGVSDLEVWSLLRDRPNSSLWLRTDLHAKFYRADDRCLIGSANLTNTALGWTLHPNLELLIPSPAGNADVVAFESELFQGSVQVDESIFQQMSAVVALVRQNQLPVAPTFYIPEQATPDHEIIQAEEFNPDAHWLPTLRYPADLYLAYAGRREELTAAARRAAEADLCELPIPLELSRTIFEAYVSVLLLQKPLLRQVDGFLATPQRFGAVRDFLRTLPCAANSDFNATSAWQTLMRWLLYFLPLRYTLVPSRHSEVLHRIST